MKIQAIAAYLTAIMAFTPFVRAGELNVTDIRFTGGEFNGRAELNEIIRTEKGDEFDARLVKLDKILLTNYYRVNGFMDVVAYDSVAMSRDRQAVSIRYRIDAGTRYYFHQVIISGNAEIKGRVIRRQFDKILLMKPINEGQINEAIKKVENVYYNSGKPFVQLDVRYDFSSDSLVSLIVEIEENETVYINEVQYLGLDVVQDFIIRRELELNKGDLYSREAIDESQKNIYSTNLFKFVRMEIEPIKKQGAQVILKIHVQERDARWIGVRLGVGYEEEQSFGNTLDLTLQGGHRNILGTARSASLHLTPSISYDLESGNFHNPLNKIQFRFIEPWIGYTRTPGIFQLGYEQHQPLNSGSFNMWQASFDVRHEFKDDHELSGALAIKLVEETDEMEIDSSLADKYGTDQSKIYSATVYWKRDNRVNIFFPVNSSYTDVSLTFSHSVGRVEDVEDQINNYFTLVSSWQRYQPYRPQIFNFKRWRFTLASRMKIGSILEFGEIKKIPINDRFYLGGAASVRGYQERLLGPALEKDENGKITRAAGGKLQMLGNIELRMPLVWILVLETFIDGGYVWLELDDFNPVDIKFTTGLGLAFITPLGPVRFDYGYKLMPVKQDPTPDAYHLGIYFAF